MTSLLMKAIQKSNIFIVAYTNKSNDTLFDNTLFKYNYLGLCKFSDIIL